MTQIHPGYVVRAVDDEAAREEILATRTTRSAAIAEIDRYVASLPVECDSYASSHWDGSLFLTGVKPKEWPAQAEHAAMGALGYKWRPKHGKVYTPDKTTVKGKALAKDLDLFSFRQPHIQGLGGIIGVSDTPPGTPTHLSKHYLTGWHFWIYEVKNRRHPYQVFAGFGPPYLDERSQQAVIDAGDRWKPARLSAYHIAREVHLSLHPESMEDESE